MNDYKDDDDELNKKIGITQQEFDDIKEENDAQIFTTLNNIFKHFYENDLSYSIMLTQLVDLINASGECIISVIDELKKFDIYNILFEYNKSNIKNKSATLQLIEHITYYGSEDENFSDIIQFLLSLIPSEEEEKQETDYFHKYKYVVRAFTNISDVSHIIASSLCESKTIDAIFSLVTNEMTSFDEGEVFELPDNSDELPEMAIHVFSIDVANFFESMMSYELFYPEQYISVIIQYFSSIAKSLCVNVAEAGLDGLTESLEYHYENVMDIIILYIGQLVQLLAHPNGGIVTRAIRFFAYIFLNDYPNIKSKCLKEGIMDKIENIYENRLEECPNISDLICNILAYDEINESYLEMLFNFISVALEIGSIKMKVSLSYVFYVTSRKFPYQTFDYLLDNKEITEELVNMVASGQIEYLEKMISGFSFVLEGGRKNENDLDPIIEMMDTNGVDRDYLEGLIDCHPEDDDLAEACKNLIESIEEPFSSDESQTEFYDCGSGFEFQAG